MRGKIGTSTTCNSIIPNFKELYRIYPKKLSREAKQRLRVLDYFYNKAHKKVSVTARYFGVSRTYVYKWIKRYNRWDLATLESRSRRPKRVRTVQYDTHAVNTIRKIRQEYPSFSAVKVSVILLRDYAIKLSSATVGRISAGLTCSSLKLWRCIETYPKLPPKAGRCVKRKSACGIISNRIIPGTSLNSI